MEPINAILLVITLLCAAVCVWLVVRAARADIRMAKKVAQAVKLISTWKNDEEGLLTRFAFYNYKDEPDVLYLSNLFVEEASRNHGLGTMILKAAEMVAVNLGATYIRLKVMKNARVRDWYYRRGFDLIADENGYSWLEKRIGHISAEAPAELEAEIDKEVKKLHTAPCYDELAAFARHFFSLGASKAEKKKRVTMSGFYKPVSPNSLVNIPDLANKGALFQDAGFVPGEPVEIIIEEK